MAPKISLNLIFLLAVLTANSQTFNDSLFEHIKIMDRKVGEINLHVTKTSTKKPLPLLLYLDGSGNFPLFYRNKSGSYSKTVPLDMDYYSKYFRIVIISKPGIPFVDDLQYKETEAYYPTNKLFKDTYSLDWRVNSASSAIDYLHKKFKLANEKIIVVGYSEGSQVAPKVAVLNRKVTHVICMVGNSLNQFYDFIISARVKAEKNVISFDESQKIVDSLYIEYEKIYSDPKAVGKSWDGETYLKWSSFASTQPLESMLQLDIPILYIGAGRDDHQTVINMDYARLEFLRKGKKNLTYKVYPNLNHFFQEFENENFVRDWIGDVHKFAIDWINKS